MDMNLSTTVAKENDLERLVDSFTEAMQTARREAFKIINTQSKTNQKKSVPWWTDSLTITRERINALRRLHQRTRNNEELRKSRKHKHLEEKKSINMKSEERNSTRGRSTVMWQHL